MNQILLMLFSPGLNSGGNRAGRPCGFAPGKNTREIGSGQPAIGNGIDAVNLRSTASKLPIALLWLKRSAVPLAVVGNAIGFLLLMSGGYLALRILEMVLA